MMTTTTLRANAIRKFNRFYTKQIGLLNPRYMDTTFSLTQIRVLYELSQCEQVTAKTLATELDLDEGYLSRILAQFAMKQLILKKTSSEDRRQHYISLTKKGWSVFKTLESKHQDEILTMLTPLSNADQHHLVSAMQTIETLFRSQVKAQEPYILRQHKPGDMGWVIHRHGALYFQEYGWDETFEAFVAEHAEKFIRNFDPKRERSWIVEQNGNILGSAFLIAESKEISRIRMLLVEPKARGMGIGNRLVNECICFAKEVGYKKIILWTNARLSAAQHLYSKAGFHLVEKKSHYLWGHDQVSEFWEMNLPSDCVP